MQLRARFTPTGDLDLKAITFSMTEFASLERILRLASPAGGRGVSFVRHARDSAGRMVRLYKVPRHIIKMLESLLGGSFERDGTFTTMAGFGQTFSCREVNGAGCEDIFADDQDLAVVKCALVASRNHWFGGIANVGDCSKPS